MKSIQELSPYPSLRIAKLSKAINLTMSRLFNKYGYNITREQEVILRELRKGDGINQVELAVRTGQERNNLSRTLTILERKNLIERKVCEEDKRNSLVFITDAGNQLHEQVYKAITEYRKILYANLSVTQAELLSEGIQKITKNLENYLDQSKP